MKPRRGLECRNRKTHPFCPSLPHVVTINGFQVLLSNITCLPSYPIKRRYLPHSSPYPVYMPHPISKWPTRSLSHSLYPGYKSGPRTPVQHWFSFELAHCSNSVSHSNKLYFPLFRSHDWKLFSNLRPDHNSTDHPEVRSWAVWQDPNPPGELNHQSKWSVRLDDADLCWPFWLHSIRCLDFVNRE